MDNLYLEQLKDCFSASELVELMSEDISTEDVFYAFRDVFEENEDMIKEYMLDGR